MLVGFYGPPCSGKTTLAHSLFAALKQMGYSGEFVSEYARTYIARNKERISKDGMKDLDQDIIFNEQACSETIYEKQTLVVTDTCTANTCFYSDQLYSISTIEEQIERYDVIFVTSLIEESMTGNDKNRVHNLDQCRDLNEKMFDALNSMSPTVKVDRVFHLTESTEDNVLSAISFIQGKLNAKRTA